METERAEALLAFLRRSFCEPELSWATPPRLLARGVQAKIFALRLASERPEHAGPLVARVFVEPGQDGQARYEFAVQRALAEQGYPAPAALAVGGDGDGLGRAFVVMEQLPGKPLMDRAWWLMVAVVVAVALEVGFLVPFAAGLFFWLSVAPVLRLHAVPEKPFLEALDREGITPKRTSVETWFDLLEERAAAIGLDARAAIQWLRASLPGDGARVLCHGDYHVGNVLVTRRGLSGVIDWSGATLAPPEFEFGWTVIQPLLIAQLPLGIPRRLRLLLDEAMRPVIAFGTAPVRWLYRVIRGLDSARLRYFSALAALRALVLLAELHATNPWHNPHTLLLLSRRFERDSGVRIEVPEALL